MSPLLRTFLRACAGIGCARAKPGSAGYTILRAD
jgi:hypothetical protein